MQRLVVLGIIYIVLVYLLIESATAVTKKLIVLKSFKEQFKRLNINGKLKELTTDKPEIPLKRGMLNYQKAYILTCLALSSCVCAGLLANDWQVMSPLYIILIEVVTITVATIIGSKLSSRKAWAIEGCSKLIAVSTLYSLVGYKTLQDKLVRMREHVDKCPTIQVYNSGIKDKIENIMIECEREYGSGKSGI